MKLSTICVFWILPVTALSQGSDTTVLRPVVVSATRLPTPVSDVSQPVVVLNGDQLRARGVSTVAQALRQAPGVTIAQSGSDGGVTSLFMRGGESRYTKVLIDGVPINAVGGVQFFENLSMDNVDRIEVVYGPSSALYGADAVTGVIQIFTRRGGGPPNIDADLRAGGYGTRDGSATVRGGGTRADYSLGGGWHATSGTAAFNNGYSNGDLSGALTIRPDSLSSVATTARYTGSLYHFPTDYTGAVNDSTSYTREHRLVLGVDASRAIANGVRVRFLGGDNEIHGLSEDTQASGVPATPRKKTMVPTDGFRRSGEVRLETSLAGIGTATIGSQYQVEEQRNRTVVYNFATSTDGMTPQTAPGADDHRTTRGYYVALQGTPISWASYDASARRDSHSDFGSVNTYHAGVSLELWDAARLRASYGTGFNAPAFYETQGSAYNAPNASLQPEQSHSLDVHLEQNLFSDALRITAGGFDQRFSNQIQYVGGTSGGPPDYIQLTPAFYSNLTQARAKGYDATLSLALPTGLTASASYTQTIAQVYSVPAGYAGSQRPGDALLRRPGHSGSATVFYSHDAAWTIGAGADYEGRRPDMDFSKYPSPMVTLPAYTTLDLSGSVRVIDSRDMSMSLTGRLENALDRHHEDVYNFPAPGRRILVGARVTAVR